MRLARSINEAQNQQSADAVPASPTLARLLAASSHVANSSSADHSTTVSMSRGGGMGIAPFGRTMAAATATATASTTATEIPANRPFRRSVTVTSRNLFKAKQVSMTRKGVHQPKPVAVQQQQSGVDGGAPLSNSVFARPSAAARRKALSPKRLCSLQS
jgi:hypothetical protein